MDATEPIRAVWRSIKATKPAFLRKKPHFTFITVHCTSPNSMPKTPANVTLSQISGSSA